MSGTGYIGKTTNQATEVTSAIAADEREAQWGEIPGEIVSYDAAKQTATIKPLYKPTHAGKPVDMPNLEEVPVRFARTGSGALTMPMPAGSKVVLRPQMRSSEKWHTEQDGEATDRRSFALSDMEAHLDGGDSLADPLPNVDPDNTHLRFDAEGNYGVRGSPDGRVKIEGSQGDIYALVSEAVGLCAEGFDLLGTEATLDHMTEYATLGAQLQIIAGKLAAMQL